MKTKYTSRVLTVAIILLVVVAGVLLGLYGNFDAGSADALMGREPSRVVLVAGIPQCPQAEYGESGMVSNGHSTDQQDLYSRHQECSRPVSLAMSLTVAPNPQIVDVYIPAKKVIVTVYVTYTNHNSHNSGGNVSNTTVKQDDGTKTDNSAGKVCKNKNAGKDGTPDECNAGKGQEKDKK